jgi:hypothetical protein
MYTPDWQATLSELDEREKQIERSLRQLKETLSAREYRQKEARYAKELIGIETRRKLIRAFIIQEIADILNGKE